MSALPSCCASVALFVFVGFSDDRRLAIVVRFGVAVFVLGIIIVVVGVPRRRHRVAHDGDAAPVDQPGRKALGDAQGYVGLLLEVATFRNNVSARGRAR